jgi:hypothetical protein
MEIAANIGWMLLFIVLGSLVGTILVFVASAFLPKLLNKMTPHIDEEKEIAKGNVAVAQYFGRVSSAAIIGVSIVIAAAVVGGTVAALF